MAFSGFGRGFFDFFGALAANNEKAWFEANRARYEAEVKAPLQDFVAAMATRLPAISKHFTADPKTSVFRIHRDTRFSKDKSPYKTNAGLHFRHATAGDAHAPGYYLHLAPGQVFYGGGLWKPEPAALAQIRQAIVEKPEDWAAAKGEAGVVTTFGGMAEGEPLARPPRGFPADHPHIADIKKRSFFVIRQDGEGSAGKAGFVDAVASAYGAASPVMAFLCAAVGAAF